MIRKTSEIVKYLQRCLAKYGDLPFVLRDNDNGCDYYEVNVFVNTKENGCCDEEDDVETIGIYF